MNSVWGIKKPETREEHHIFLNELYGAVEDLRKLGFKARFDFSSSKDILLVIRRETAQKCLER